MPRLVGSSAGGAVPVEADTYLKTLRVSKAMRGAGYSLAGVSGTIAAASNGYLWTMRFDPAAGAGQLLVLQKLLIQWTTLTAFTTPVTVRGLTLFRGTGATPSGQTQINPVKRRSSDSASKLIDGRIAATANITVAGITFETDAIDRFPFTDVGASGNTRLFERDYSDTPITLTPGDVLGLTTGGALDAAGTVSLAVSAEWVEGIL